MMRHSVFVFFSPHLHIFISRFIHQQRELLMETQPFIAAGKVLIFHVV